MKLECMECKIFKRNVRTKLDFLLKFKVKHFPLLITEISIYKYPVITEYSVITEYWKTQPPPPLPP